MVTSKKRQEVANIIKNNLEVLGLKVDITTIEDKETNLNYDMFLVGNILSIKPEIEKYLAFDIQENNKESYKQVYEQFNNNPNFMGLYFDSITIITSNKMKGKFKGNWYNIFYNIDTWYKVIN